jgi:hypothetical protein
MRCPVIAVSRIVIRLRATDQKLSDTFSESNFSRRM